jgi:hypothetical protein
MAKLKRRSLLYLFAYQHRKNSTALGRCLTLLNKSEMEGLASRAGDRDMSVTLIRKTPEDLQSTDCGERVFSPGKRTTTTLNRLPTMSGCLPKWWNITCVSRIRWR